MDTPSDSLTLEALPLENWETSLSFLPAREILLASHELSKSFGVIERKDEHDADAAAADVAEESDAVNVEETDTSNEKEESPSIDVSESGGTNEDAKNATGNTNTCYDDRLESAERAAKLALQNMLTRAWKYFDAYKEEHPDMIPYDDIHANLSYSPDMFEKHFVNVPRLEGESYLRTYHLALSMVDFGEDKVAKNEDGDNPNTVKEAFPLIFTMWLIYGKPYLPPLGLGWFDIGDDISKKCIITVFHNSLKREIDGLRGHPKVPVDVNRIMEEIAKRYCLGRLIRIADRCRMVGLYGSGFAIINLIAYKTPTPEECCHDAEFFIGSKVILQGLSNTELNGKSGVVKTKFNQLSGQIGVLLEGRDSLVDIKPVNLATQEVDSTVIIDFKILSAQMTHELMENQRGSINLGISKDIHMLRKVVTSLEAKIESDGGKNERAVDVEIRDGLYPTDLVRLINAKVTLAHCLVCRSNVVMSGGLLPLHGNLRPALSKWEVVEREPEIMGDPEILAYFVADISFSEAMDQVFHATDFFDKCEAQFVEGLENEAFPEGPTPIPRKCVLDPLKHANISIIIAKNFVLANIGFKGRQYGAPMLRSTGLSSEYFVAESIENVRDAFEGTIYTEEPLSVNLFFPEPRQRACQYRHTIALAKYLGMTYIEATRLQMTDLDSKLRATNECADGINILRLGLALAIRVFGVGHPYTRRLAADISDNTDYNGLDDQVRLEEDLNTWLSGSYRPLYFPLSSNSDSTV